MRERKYDEADQVLDDILTPALDRGPQSAQLWRIRAEFLAGRGRWEEAAADATQALELQPTDHVPYHMLAPLLVATGTLEQYRAHCRKTLAQFSGTANPYVADRMAKDCLILSSDGCDLEAVGKLADTAVRLGTNENALPYFQCTKGLAEYRLGRFTNAVDWAQKSIDHPSYSGDPNRFVQAYMIIAMAQHQLKQNELARAAMEQGAEIAAKKLAKPENGEVGSGWRDWIIAQALLQEAKALIDREHPPQQSDPPHSPRPGNGQ